MPRDADDDVLERIDAAFRRGDSNGDGRAYPGPRAVLAELRALGMLTDPSGGSSS